jgi:four helix bundle protein
MKDFRKLKVWEKAHRMVLSVYSVTRNFPREELYGITSQMRRASVSIPTNIAEGCGRGTDGDFSRFLQIAMGSANELEYLLLLSRDLKFLGINDCVELNSQIVEIKKMLTSLIRSVNIH